MNISNIKLVAIIFFTTLFWGQNVLAADKIIGGLKLETYTIISQWGPHQPGNLELKIEGGFTIPTELSCTDSNYVTTKNTIAGFDQIAAAAMAAFVSKKYVQLGLTDDPALTAYPGRCSVKLIVMHH